MVATCKEAWVQRVVLWNVLFQFAASTMRADMLLQLRLQCSPACFAIDFSVLLSWTTNTCLLTDHPLKKIQPGCVLKHLDLICHVAIYDVASRTSMRFPSYLLQRLAVFPQPRWTTQEQQFVSDLAADIIAPHAVQ